MQVYLPTKIQKPPNLIDVPSAWLGIESILGDIIERFGVKTDKALEFGVEYGYSTVALSNFFKKVIGVDHFLGDENTNEKNVEGMYEKVKEALAPYPIQLFNKSYQDYIYAHRFNGPYNLIHIDIAHNYEDTYACGDWAMKNAPIVLFHDTESFPEVKRAVSDLAEKHNVEFYNYPHHCGLGILYGKNNNYSALPDERKGGYDFRFAW